LKTYSKFGIIPCMSKTKPESIYPGLWKALLLTILVGLIQFLITVSLPFFQAFIGTQQSPSIITITITHSLSFSAVIAIGILHGKLSIKKIIPLTVPGALQLAALPFIVIGLHIALTLISTIVNNLYPMPDSFISTYSLLFSSKHLFISIVSLGILAPLLEEILFRGIILRGLLFRYGAYKAVIISAALFAFIHFNPWQAVPAFFAGLIFGFLYISSKSLTPCFIGHILFNSLPLITVGTMDNSSLETIVRESQMQLEISNIMLPVFGALLLAAGLRMYLPQQS